MRAFDFLKAQYVGLPVAQEAADEINSKPDGIDVPGRDFQCHGVSKCTGRAICASPQGNLGLKFLNRSSATIVSPMGQLLCIPYLPIEFHDKQLGVRHYSGDNVFE